MEVEWVIPRHGGYRKLKSFQIALATGDDADDFQAVAGVERAMGELGGCHGLAVEFDHDTARQEFLLAEESFERAGESR